MTIFGYWFFSVEFTRAGPCRCGPASRTFFVILAKKAVWFLRWYLNLNHRRFISKVWQYHSPQRSNWIRLCKHISCLLHKLIGDVCQRPIHHVRTMFRLLSSNFSALQRHCLKIEKCLERWRYAYFIRHLRFCQTIFKHELRYQRTVERSSKKPPFAKNLRKELYNPAVLHHAHMDCQRCSEHLPKFLSCELTKGHVLIFKNWDCFSGDFLREALTSNLSMISCVAGTAPVPAYFQKLFTESSRRLSLVL